MKDINNYYLAIYDLNDNYITQLENIDEATTLFNKQKKELNRIIKNDDCLVYLGHKVRIYLFKKFNIDEAYKRCTN